MENKFIYFIFIFLIAVFRRKSNVKIIESKYIENPRKETFKEYFSKIDEKKKQEIINDLF